VADTGAAGIAPSDLPRVFERFFQADHVPARPVTTASEFHLQKAIGGGHGFGSIYAPSLEGGAAPSPWQTAGLKVILNAENISAAGLQAQAWLREVMDGIRALAD